MRYVFFAGLGAAVLIATGECELHYGGSVVGGGVSVLIGGLTLLVAIVLAAAYSDAHCK